jgi:N-acetyl-1-D-myo-inositol-2-amino-2-deoxy-alpha-D-glucopyranoside deacetylase
MSTLPYTGYRMLLMHAHPDDETINNGATMAKYAAEGAAITLITSNRGEEGDILIPDLAHLGARESDQLGPHRVQELNAAMKELGITDHRFLGAPHKQYRDSGMIGTDPNQRPDNFWNCDLDEAAKFLVDIIHEVKPHVLVTYDEFGGYGHPDHIKAHQVAMRAVELATQWEVSKVYWNAIPKSIIENGIAEMKKRGTTFMGLEKAEDFPFAKADELVTTVINAVPYVDKKIAAMKAHGTQIAVDGPFFALSDNVGVQVWGDEYYTLVKGEVAGARDGQGRELDLFAGITL